MSSTMRLRVRWRGCGLGGGWTGEGREGWGPEASYLSYRKGSAQSGTVAEHWFSFCPRLADRDQAQGRPAAAAKVGLKKTDAPGVHLIRPEITGFRMCGTGRAEFRVYRKLNFPLNRIGKYPPRLENAPLTASMYELRLVVGSQSRNPRQNYCACFLKGQSHLNLERTSRPAPVAKLL